MFALIAWSFGWLHLVVVGIRRRASVEATQSATALTA